MSTQRPGAILVGASSGIGAALASELAQRGYQVALVARRTADLDALASRLNARSPDVARVYPHDVRDFDAAPAVFDHIRADLGEARLALLVYAAGLLAPTTDGGSWTFESERDTIDINLTGAMRWLALGAQVFAKQRHGSLVGVSSVAGDRGRWGNSAYMASKSGLTTYLESLRYRLASSGVRVVTIKPGFVATPMIAGVKTPGLLTISPERAARLIANVCERGPEVVYVPLRWRLIMAIVRALPSAIMKRSKL